MSYNTVNPMSMDQSDDYAVGRYQQNETEDDPLNSSEPSSSECPKNDVRKPKDIQEESSNNHTDETLSKQRNDIREYRRLQHERWRKKFAGSKPSKHLYKDVVASFTNEGTDEEPDDMPCTSAMPDESVVSQDNRGSRRRRHKKQRKFKRPRQQSEGDTLDNKRKQCSSESYGACVSPDIVDLDGGSETYVGKKYTSGNKAIGVDDSFTEVNGKNLATTKVITEVNSINYVQETVTKATGSDHEADEEITCLGVYSRSKLKAVIDLTESPSPPSERELPLTCGRVEKSGNYPDTKSSSSMRHSSINSMSAPCELANRSNQTTPVPTLSPHVFGSQHGTESSSPAFHNFLSAAVFGNAIPGFGAPIFNPDMAQNSLITGLQYDASDSAAFHRGAQNMASTSSTSSSQQRKISLLRNRPWSSILQRLKSWDVMDFTVMSYNVLAQDLLHNNLYLYRGCPSEYLSWDYRSQNLLKEILEHKPDIICLQEVYAEHFYDFFQPKLMARGYQGCFKCRTRSMKDGCATFYKESLFTLENSTPVEYYYPSVESLDRDNIALILTLIPRGKQTDVKLIVSNTHLLFNPRRGDVKLAQLMVLLSEVDKRARINSPNIHPNAPCYHPTIITGDFNSEPRSPIYRFLATGSINYENKVISEFSGQEEGLRFGGPRCFDKEIIPPRVGITDNCQYLNEVQDRFQLWKGLGTHSADKSCRSSAVGAEASPSTSRRSTTGRNEGNSTGDESLFCQCSGVLSTFLPLVSAYRHSNFSSRLNRYENEVTTHHGRANCTVDYIFYSVNSRSTKVRGDRVRLKKVQEDRLRLTKRLSLLSDSEMLREGRLPNKEVSSDHMALMAGFQLKLA